MGAPLIPKREALAQVEPRPGDDQVDRWDKAGLMCEPPGETRPPRYGYTAEQVERLKAIARIVARIGSQRTRHSEIAFWLAFEGARDVPLSLVCEHIEDSFRTFQNRTRTILNGLGRRNEGHHIGIVQTAKKLGGLIARQVLLKFIPSLARSSLAREVGGLLIGLFLYTSKKPNSYGSVARDLRQVTTVLRKDSAPPPEPVLQELFSVISDFSQLLLLDEQNPALAAVQQIRSDDPSAILWSVELANRFLAEAKALFPWMTDASTIPFLPESDKEFLNRYFVPLCCAVLSTAQSNEYAKGLAAELRAGKTDRLTSDFEKMKELGDHILGSVSPKGIEHE